MSSKLPNKIIKVKFYNILTSNYSFYFFSSEYHDILKLWPDQWKQFWFLKFLHKYNIYIQSQNIRQFQIKCQHLSWVRQLSSPFQKKNTVHRITIMHTSTIAQRWNVLDVPRHLILKAPTGINLTKCLAPPSPRPSVKCQCSPMTVVRLGYHSRHHKLPSIFWYMYI